MTLPHLEQEALMIKPTHIVPENERTYLTKPGHRARAHPLSDAFPLHDHEIKVLADDIKKNGQQVPVVLQRAAPSGETRVLDGRSRLLACELADAKPLVKYVPPNADALSLILSTNARRRHQDSSQRAMSAARLANISRGRPAGIASIEAISQEQAAELLGTSRSGVQRAAAILDDAILAAAVDAGKVAVSDAYAIRDAPDDDKRRAVAAVAADEVRTLQAALQPEAPASVQEEPTSEVGGDRPAAGPPAGAGADAMEARDAPARSDSGAEPDAGDAAATDSDSHSDESVGSDTSRSSPSASPAPAEVPAEGASTAKAAAVMESGSDSQSDESAGSSISTAESTSGQGPAETATASGGADTSPGSPSASPAPAAVPAEGASTAEAAEVTDAATARSDVPSRVHELKDASERLDSMIAQGDQGDIQHLRRPVRFRAASVLVRKLTTMMAQWLEERTDDDAVVDRTEDLPSTLDSLLKQLTREHSRDAQG